MSVENKNEGRGFYVYTPVDGNQDRGCGSYSLDEAKDLARQSARRLGDCGLPVEQTVAYVIADDNAEMVWSCDHATA